MVETKAVIFATIFMVILFIISSTMLLTVHDANPASATPFTSPAFLLLNTSIASMQVNLGNITRNANISTMDIAESNWGFLDYAYKSVISVVKISLASLGFLATFFGNVGSYLELPAPFLTIANLLGNFVTIMLFFAFISMILKQSGD
jgi:hypothetical protein